MPLGYSEPTFITNISSYRQPPTCDGKTLAYQLNNKKHELILMNLVTGKEDRFAGVDDYTFDDTGNTLVLKVSTKKDSASENSLKWINIKNNRITVVWEDLSSQKTTEIVGYSFNHEGTKLAFIIKEVKKDQPINTLWYYDDSRKKTMLLANNQPTGITKNLSISSSNAPIFSTNGQYILFQLQDTVANKRKIDGDAVQVDVWSYNDSILPSAQLSSTREFWSVIGITDKQVIRLEQEDEVLNLYSGRFNDFVILNTKNSVRDYWWETYKLKSSYLVSLKDGSRKFLNTDSVYFPYTFSPEGKYLIYYDVIKRNYYSYNLVSGKRLNISQAISSPLSTDQQQDSTRNIYQDPVGIAGWLAKDHALLVYDQYDIWELDPMNERAPINLTNNYGRENQIKFRLIYENSDSIYSPNDILYLTAFNIKNKQNGFYSIVFNKRTDPKLLTMGSFHMCIQPTQAPMHFSFRPQKVKETSEWLVKRESADNAPNFFLTTDFTNYKRLTDLQPQKKYNWLTTELITWRQFDGSLSQGILYKPEDFATNKKYPLIFFYYEQISQNLNVFPQPEFSIGAINIAWFVSHGYLVFIPDIHYYVGKEGESVCNSVESAAVYLSQFPWVDAHKMGLSGHSYGGYETNYLVTHTNLFAAAASAAGVSDLISAYGGISGYGHNTAYSMYESGQHRMGFNIWERPDLYIANSPIFKADQVKTPLLIMHNKADLNVPWSQSVELFTALRRLRKKTWMLQYDQGSHTITKRKDAIDYTIRLTQFFNHYLKGELPPKWMTEGIPATLKGIETGYELDNSGREP